MSKFFKALEQAERDRALQRPTNGAVASLEPPLVSVPAPRPVWTPPPPEPPGGVDEHLVSLVTPASFDAEQYRALRHNVERLHKATGLKMVAVSSPAAGDGKTMTAINLAGALAQAPEVRVLLIDADLRRSAVGHRLGLPESEEPGLVSAILEPHLTLAHIVRSRPPFNLSVICAGPTPASPYEVLKSSRLGELLDEARQQYDYIVVDTPPLTPVQDCRVIGRWVDGFLIVVAALRTPRRLVEESLTTLDSAKILGFVFNEEQLSMVGGYAAYYGEGYHTPRERSTHGQGSRGYRNVVSRLGASLRRRAR